jgi:GT2 family glycosyltransferase
VVAAPAPPRVSVVMPTYGRRASVERALRALSRQTLHPDQYEVIVSVDGSDDGTREMLAQFRAPYRLRFLWQPNRGRAAACNAGIRLADADLIVLLDDDMEPTAQFLAAHLRIHMTDSSLGVMGAAPIAVDSASPPITQYVAAHFNHHLERLACSDHQFVLRDFYSGNFSIARDMLLAVGAFDEEFTVYGNEDLELSIRLARAGVRLTYNPDAVARQHHTKSFAQLAHDSICRGHTAVLLASKHPTALPDLQLGAYHQASLKWRLLRSGMLRLHALWRGAPGALIGLVEQVERSHPPFLNTLYRLALDYFYWVGVGAALRENQRTGRGLIALPESRERI